MDTKKEAFNLEDFMIGPQLTVEEELARINATKKVPPPPKISPPTKEYILIDKQWAIGAAKAGTYRSYGALYVGLLLWHLLYVQYKKQPIQLTGKRRESFSLKRKQFESGLKALEEAGLVKVERSRNKAPIVTILKDGKKL
jgi:hypothetical protein